jgi:SPASM domain peptide maturase of grasp-with-spasm system
MCECIEIRTFIELPVDWLSSVLRVIDDSPVFSVQMIIKYVEREHDIERIKHLIGTHSRISYILIHSSNQENLLNINNFSTIQYTMETIHSPVNCGRISPSLFAVNRLSIFESHHHNSCLNRKISIDTEGNIKNCPSMTQSFGNIRDTTLQEALDHPDFKKYWNVTKDQIAVCKDCEFRYICTDCRAYIENPEDMYSKPLKCGYNPYTCEWEEWSTNPLKQMAIDHYGMREVLPEFKLKPDYVPPRSTDTAAANAPAGP